MLSADTKNRRLESLTNRIAKAEAKAAELRSRANTLDAEIKAMQGEKEWLEKAPVAPTGQPDIPPVVAPQTSVGEGQMLGLPPRIEGEPSSAMLSEPVGAAVVDPALIDQPTINTAALPGAAQ